MKRIFVLFLAAVMVFFLAACGEDAPAVVQPTEPEETEGASPVLGEMVILFTGGLEGVYARDDTVGAVGYPALAAYADELKEGYETVILIDGGDSVDPQAPAELWDVVDACGYDLRVPGELELSGSVEKLKDLAEKRDYISCNLMDLTENSTVFAPYLLVEAEGTTVGFVGVTKPVALTDGNYVILGLDDAQLLRDTVQAAVDAAADAGADYVIVVGDLGTDPGDSPCTTAEVIAGITGFAAWLDCGSGAVLDGDTVADKDDFEIPVCAPGSRFAYAGRVTLDLNTGAVQVKLVTDLEKEDRTVLNLVGKLDEE